MSLEIDTDFRWPKKGDRLLRRDDDWRRGVTFEEHKIARDVHIWDGYMKAGAALVDECQRLDSRLDRHELVYPMLYCYRHGLELAMKWIIGQYGRYSQIPRDDYQHHNLWDLWKLCKQVMLEVGSDDEESGVRAVEQVVKDFHELDRGSFSFRYSTDKNGMVISLPTEPFDLGNIKDVMEGVNNLFSGADGQLSHNVSNVDWETGY